MIPKCSCRAQFINHKYRCIHQFIKSDYVSPGVCKICPVAEFGGKCTSGQKEDCDVPENIDLYNIKFTERIIIELETTTNTTDTGPGPEQQIDNLMSAVDRFISDGQYFVSKEEYVSRLTKCLNCPFRNSIKCTNKSCGCDIRQKAMLASEKCPIDQW